MNDEILVVDDEAIVRDFLAETLKRKKLEVYTAQDGKSASALLKNQAFDLVFTDMKMPDAFTLVVNANNVLVKNILKMNEDVGNVAQVKTLCDHVYDTARMNNQPLTGDALQSFISRSNQIMSLYSER